MPQVPEKPVVKGVADIVFCVDATASMTNCLEDLKSTIEGFVKELEKIRDVGEQKAQVSDWKVRLLPFRDLNVDGEGGMVEGYDFVKSVAEFKKQLEATGPSGGGDAPESGLDALFRAAKRSKWRGEKEAHRFVLLFSDDKALPTLHPSTSEGPNDLKFVIQILKQNKVKPIVIAQECPEYRAVTEVKPSVKSCSRLFDSFEKAEEFFKSKADFSFLMDHLAAAISQSSSEEL